MADVLNNSLSEYTYARSQWNEKFPQLQVICEVFSIICLKMVVSGLTFASSLINWIWDHSGRSEIHPKWHLLIQKD